MRTLAFCALTLFSPLFHLPTRYGNGWEDSKWLWYSNTTDFPTELVKEGTLERGFSWTQASQTGQGWTAFEAETTICVIDEYGPCYIFEV